MTATNRDYFIKSRRSSDFAGLGAPNASAPGHITAVHEGDGPVIQTTLTLTDVELLAGNTTGVSFGSVKLYDFPEGRIGILSTTAYFPSIDWSDAARDGGDAPAATGSGDYSLGTTAADDGTLTGTDVDILPSSAMLDPFVASVGRSNAGTALAAMAQWDGTTTAVDMYLNALIDDADVSDGDAGAIVKFTGTIKFTWVNLGDYVTS